MPSGLPFVIVLVRFIALLIFTATFASFAIGKLRSEKVLFLFPVYCFVVLLMDL
jgi:hypothetical protein